MQNLPGATPSSSDACELFIQYVDNTLKHSEESPVYSHELSSLKMTQGLNRRNEYNSDEFISTEKLLRLFLRLDCNHSQSLYIPVTVKCCTGLIITTFGIICDKYIIRKSVAIRTTLFKLTDMSNRCPGI